MASTVGSCDGCSIPAICATSSNPSSTSCSHNPEASRENASCRRISRAFSADHPPSGPCHMQKVTSARRPVRQHLPCAQPRQGAQGVRVGYIYTDRVVNNCVELLPNPSRLTPDEPTLHARSLLFTRRLPALLHGHQDGQGNLCHGDRQTQRTNGANISRARRMGRSRSGGKRRLYGV